MLVLLLVSIDTFEASSTNRNELKLVLEVRELSIEDSVRLVLSEKNLSKYTIELLVAQSKHESGNYKNSLSRLHKNIFSRHWDKYDTLSLGAGGQAEGHSNFARYKSIKNATLSQLHYFQRKKYTMEWTTAKEFAVELKSKRYYEDDVNKYTTALNKLIKPIKHDLDTMVLIYN